MDSGRKQAKDFLQNADRPTFLEVVYRAKVTPRQKEILYKHILDGKDLGFIADDLAVSYRTITKSLGLAYGKIYKYLFRS